MSYCQLEVANLVETTKENSKLWYSGVVVPVGNNEPAKNLKNPENKDSIK